MVELQASPYDSSDFIPFADAAIVTYDDELSGEPPEDVPTAESLSSMSPSSSASISIINAPLNPNTTPSASVIPTRSDGARTTETTVPQETPLPKAAATGGAVVGMFLGGPFLSLIAGVGAHHYSKQEGAMGDCARALGEIALVTRDKFRQVNERHQLVDKSKDAACRTIRQMHQADRKHKLREKVGYLVSHCYAVTLDFVYRHQLIDRGAETAKMILDKLTEALRNQHNPVTQETCDNNGIRIDEPRNENRSCRASVHG